MSNTIRVRELLSTLNSIERTELKKLLPKGLKVPPEPDGIRYPAALLSALPKEESYSLLGHIAEAMLRHPPMAITTDTLTATIREWVTDFSDAAATKVVKSKTTEPFLAHIRETRKKIRAAAGAETALQYDTVVGSPAGLNGHPDIRTATCIFEVKLTGQLAKGWPEFLLQTFAYAALAPETTDLYIVLPLQEIVWHHGLSAWTSSGQRTAFAAALQAAASKKVAGCPTKAAALALCAEHHIGSHERKLKTVDLTIQSLPAAPQPSQIFLSGPQTSKMTLDAADTAAARLTTEERGLRWYVHSPYIINLCTPPGTSGDYHTACLVAQLRGAAAAGARGVVVHVGKYTTQPLSDALEHMRANLQTAMAAATAECPVLLETPAGQGTEVLTTPTEFVAFVRELTGDGADSRLRICVDTCHVFATGCDPCEYIQAIPPHLLTLVHFNDSATPCGSRLDRHAFCGEGHIGLTKMSAVASLCSAAGVPMVIE